MSLGLLSLYVDRSSDGRAARFNAVGQKSTALLPMGCGAKRQTNLYNTVICSGALHRQAAFLSTIRIKVKSRCANSSTSPYRKMSFLLVTSRANSARESKGI